MTAEQRQKLIRLLEAGKEISPEWARGLDMRVFDEEENVGRRLALLSFDELLLQREGSEIIHSAELLVKKFNHC